MIAFLSRYKIYVHFFVVLGAAAIGAFHYNGEFHDNVMLLWSYFPKWLKLTCSLVAELGAAYWVTTKTQQVGQKIVVAMLALTLSTAAFAQTPPTSTFSIEASVAPISCGSADCTTPATDIGWTLALLNNFDIRQDNILVPSTSVTYAGAGGNYYLPTAWLNKTKLPKNSFQPYLTGSLGVVHIAPIGVPASQHLGGLIGGGLNYSPNANGHFTVSIGELRWADWTGYNKSMVIFSSGIGWHF